jgi:cell division initiation protein
MAGRRPTPTEQVHAPDFPIALRGYDRAAVDAYVSRVIQVVDELEARQTPDGVVKRALEQVGAETSEILKRAHETADEISSRSRSQAAGRVRQAEQDAEQIVADAEERARRLESDTLNLWDERVRLIEDLRQLAEAVLSTADDALERVAPPSHVGQDDSAPETAASEDATVEDPTVEVSAGEGRDDSAGPP